MTFWFDLRNDHNLKVIDKTDKRYKMGNGMNKVLPGLYVGNFRDSRDDAQLKDNKITHIVSIHDNAKPLRADMIYLCIGARDAGNQDIAQYFAECNDFIHSARIYGGNVLVHCLAGMSRSVAITVAYIMTITDLGWRDALNVVRVGRQCASPNYGFQKQLLDFQHDGVAKERRRLMAKYPKYPQKSDDSAEVKQSLEKHQEWVLNGSVEDPEQELYPLPHKAYQSDQSTSSSTSAKSNKLTGSPTKEKTDPKHNVIVIDDSESESCSDSTGGNKPGGSGNSDELVKTFFGRGPKNVENRKVSSPEGVASTANSATVTRAQDSDNQKKVDAIFENSKKINDAHL